ncbi:sensor histidine kinase [Candidatus Uabimicrobium amorphum]|uniref:histidine kinase n=1 Tax=Uabimicrobium amorphum TaxID=2596890 RepID=A0A5S9F6C4_UABAM|nr:HAMP domain-containing sensor histidine kinase [Candidatus Uabimicrobium amorphum]BBM87757.1 histidine kinase [Candidatus Uabimicrobium amorphum]
MRWKKLRLVIVFLCITTTLSYIFYSYRISYVDKNWESYRQNFLYDGLFDVQQRFFSLEKQLRHKLDYLINTTELQSCFRKHLKARSQRQRETTKTALFEQLFRKDVSKVIEPYGIAVFASYKNTPLIAWKNWSIDLPFSVLNEALSGVRTSYILNSQEKIYTMLCCFVPIFDNGKCLGTFAISTRLNTRYLLSHRYIKTQYFTENDLEKELSARHIQEIAIHFTQKNDFFEDGLQQPFFNLNMEHMGWVILVSKSKETVLENIYKNGRVIRNATWGVFGFVLLILFLYNIYCSTFRNTTKLFLSIGILIAARYIFIIISFPIELFELLNLPIEFCSESTMIFASQIYHFELSGTPIDFLLTNLFLFLGCRLLQEYGVGKINRNRFTQTSAFKIGMLCVFCLAFTLSYYFLHTATRSIVEDSSVKFVINDEIIPSSPQIILMLAVIFLGLALVLLNAQVIRYCIRLYEGWDKYYLFVPLPFVCYYSVLPETNNFYLLMSCMAGAVCFCWAISLLVFYFPKVQTIRRTVILFFVCLTIYPIMYYESKAKIRDNISSKQEEKAEIASNYKSKDFIEQILDNQLWFNKELIKSLESFNDDAAFLLWANNTILNSYFRNIYISVYVKVPQPLPLGLDANRFFYWGDDEIYYELSSFSSGVAKEQWYEAMIKKDLPHDRLFVLAGVSGYGYSTQEKKSLLTLGGKPIFKGEEIIGYVAILTMYEKISQMHTNYLAYGFSQESIRDSLLRAYFDKEKLIETSIPYMTKTFSPPPVVLENVGKGNTSVWLTQNIENVPYDCFYFPHEIQLPYYDENDDKLPKYQVRKIIGLIGYPVPSTIFMIFYFLQLFFAGLLCVIVPNFLWNGAHTIIRENKISNLSFERKLLISFFTISAIPVLLLAIYSREHAVQKVHENYRHTLTNYLEGAYTAMEEEDYLLQPFAENGNIISYNLGTKFCEQWHKENRQILNVYMRNKIFVSNGRDFFQTELLSERLPGEIYYNLILLKRDTFIHIQDTGFIVGYKAAFFHDNARVQNLILSIPMVYEKSRVESEITSILVNIITIYVICLLIIIVAAFLLINHIVRPLKQLITGINRVSTGDLAVEIPRTSNDEIGQLIAAFNRMTKDLEVSRHKLVQAEKNAAWREMSRQIAHEIKNPLTPMRLSAQHILRAYEDQARQFPVILQRGISNIIEAIDSLAKTATSFSEFAKFTKPNLEVCNLEDILLTCVNLFEEYKEKDITTQLHIENEIPHVFVDPHQVKRVFINLVTNAIHAMEDKEDEGHINIICNYSSPQTYVVVEVRDNGCGVPEHVKPHLFEPNFSTKSYGSGLGLAITKRSIENMNGEISIESKEGVGTTVFVKLPIQQMSCEDQ